MDEWLDGSLYPDTEPPVNPLGLPEQVDFLARLCSAWDFGILPRMDTVNEVRRPQWRPAVDACNLLTSPAYHLLRRWHNLPSAPYLGDRMAYICEDENLTHV